MGSVSSPLASAGAPSSDSQAPWMFASRARSLGLRTMALAKLSWGEAEAPPPRPRPMFPSPPRHLSFLFSAPGIMHHAQPSGSPPAAGLREACTGAGAIRSPSRPWPRHPNSMPASPNCSRAPAPARLPAAPAKPCNRPAARSQALPVPLEPGAPPRPFPPGNTAVPAEADGHTPRQEHQAVWVRAHRPASAGPASARPPPAPGLAAPLSAWSAGQARRPHRQHRPPHGQQLDHWRHCPLGTGLCGRHGLGVCLLTAAQGGAVHRAHLPGELPSRPRRAHRSLSR